MDRFIRLGRGGSLPVIRDGVRMDGEINPETDYFVLTIYDTRVSKDSWMGPFQQREQIIKKWKRGHVYHAYAMPLKGVVLI
jgi:hypothetical protein